MEQTWLDIVATIFEIAIVPILGAITVYVITWIKAKKQELASKADDEMAKKYLDLLENTIIECVLATNQTYVDALKEEGKFDAEAHKKAFQLTYDAVMAILTEDAQKYLCETVNDLTAYITNKIEAQVKLMKY